MFSKPGIRSSNYVSYFCSPYHVWFQEMGYPLLDINRFEDGEFEIIQYHTTPVVPALTKWSRVLMRMRNVEITPWIVEKYTAQLDLERGFVWDELKKSEKAAKEQQAAEDKHVEDLTTRQFQVIRNNPALMDRVAKNGLKEIGLRQLARHIPNHFYR